MKYLAHSGYEGRPEGQLLKEHLLNVAALAEGFFDNPSFKSLSRLIGLYHDAGKYQAEFQLRIGGDRSIHVDHSTVGAKLLAEQLGKDSAPIPAFPIMGHHGGMPNGAGEGINGRTLEERLFDELPMQAVKAFEEEMGEWAKVGSIPSSGLRATRNTDAFEQYMMIHMLHSALVDADYLDTERFYEPKQNELRGNRPSVQSLLPALETYMKGLNAETETASSDIAQIRQGIYAQCVAAAQKRQGFFSLTVPTGGGKTLSSLAFALHHAKHHENIQRVIYAIPFTSIIEQNAKVFRDAVGTEAVLEHHSAIRMNEKGDASDRAAENWDAPLVVTTNVQLFESLFSNKPSKCRKLHHLQNSIIVLDEMQALPDELLRPCLTALSSLVRNYHATVVICTATQPNYDNVWVDKPEVEEIMEHSRALYEAMRRTKMEYLGVLGDDALSSRLIGHTQVLCIVNNRKHGRMLAQTLGGEKAGVFYLSTLMCPEHRSQKLQYIRTRLKEGMTCRVISTSLIEAGVDVDFPVVYRALAGLDSIIQAAGRCNRNGLMNELASVYVFTPSEARAPAQTQRLGQMTLQEVIALEDDAFSPQAIEKYFSIRFHAGAILDKNDILLTLQQQRDMKFPFATIAEQFRLIQSAGEGLIIPYDEAAREWIAQLEKGEALGVLLRNLQRYSVNLYSRDWDDLSKRGFIREVGKMRVLDAGAKQVEKLYSEEYGLEADAEHAFLDW